MFNILFNPILKQVRNKQEGDMDFEPDKGDCVRQQEDTMGKFWSAKPVFKHSDACEHLRPKTQ
jgi:benzylsuccinate synthase/naphthyl-2-methylsuccinate synthase gamma subunit